MIDLNNSKQSTNTIYITAAISCNLTSIIRRSIGERAISAFFVFHGLITNLLINKTTLYIYAFVDCIKVFYYQLRDVIWHKLIKNGYFEYVRNGKWVQTWFMFASTLLCQMETYYKNNQN